MSRPAHVPAGPAADARASLPEPEHVAFDRLAGAVLAAPSAPLGGPVRRLAASLRVVRGTGSSYCRRPPVRTG